MMNWHRRGDDELPPAGVQQMGQMRVRRGEHQHHHEQEGQGQHAETMTIPVSRRISR